ncbi:MAG: DUF1572 domain-containing protein [Bacteroidota bacterium]
MRLSEQIAQHSRQIHQGPSFTGSDLKMQLSDVDWQLAIRQVYGLNSIAVLVFHINYYVSAVVKVLEGGPLEASDKYSFDMLPIDSQEAWKQLLNKLWTDADTFARLVEKMPETQLKENFLEGKYGNYYRNLTGLLEHTNYHLGQIALLKKILLQMKENE